MLKMISKECTTKQIGIQNNAVMTQHKGIDLHIMQERAGKHYLIKLSR